MYHHAGWGLETDACGSYKNQFVNARCESTRKFLEIFHQWKLTELDAKICTLVWLNYVEGKRPAQICSRSLDIKVKGCAQLRL